MSDAWKIEYGLNLHDASDTNGDLQVMVILILKIDQGY